MGYSIKELQKIKFHSSQRRSSVAANAFVLLHKFRNKAGRNDFVLNKAMCIEIGYEKKELITFMVANFPEKKLQLIFNPKGLGGEARDIKIHSNKNVGLIIGMTGLIENFMYQNGYDISEEKNYFYARLEIEKTFEQGKMLAMEFSIIKDSVIHEYRD